MITEKKGCLAFAVCGSFCTLEDAYEVIGDPYQIVKYPSRVVVGFDGGLHQQSTTQYVGYVSIQTLNVFGSV